MVGTAQNHHSVPTSRDCVAAWVHVDSICSSDSKSDKNHASAKRVDMPRNGSLADHPPLSLHRHQATNKDGNLAGPFTLRVVRVRSQVRADIRYALLYSFTGFL